MRAVLLTLALLIPALSACSGGETEKVAGPTKQEQADSVWKKDAAKELGSDAFDFPALQQQAAIDCMRTEVDQWTVAMALSGSRSSTDLTRVGLVHLCPDAAKSYDAAAKIIENTDNPLILVCGPDVVLSDADAQAARLVCAGR